MSHQVSVQAGGNGHTAQHVDAATLQAMLLERVRGEVRFDDGSRSLYATDASNYRQVPIGVVVPRTMQDVVETVACCHAAGAPVLARGGGTSLAGQCCNVAVVLDTSKYLNRVLSIDPERRQARVEPGIILDDVKKAAEPYGLTFGPDPATHDHCTIGGMIGNNSCGMHAQMAGKMEDNVLQMEVLTYDGLRLTVGPTSPDELERIIRSGGRRGEIYRGLRDLRDRYASQIREGYPKLPRRVSGYNLPDLLPEKGFDVARALVGTECTCVLVLEATLRLIPDPPFKTLLVLGYPSIYDAGDHVPDILPFEPMALEGLDDRLIGSMRKKHMYEADVGRLPEGRGWLMAQFGGQSRDEADDRARRCMDALRRKPGTPSMKLLDDPDQEKEIWNVREAGLGATAFVPGQPDTFEGWEDSAVPTDRLGAYLRDLRRLFDKYRYECSLYGHFGQACVHTRIPFRFNTADGVQEYLRFMDEATDLVVRYGGSFSGEHGDGQSKAMFLPKMFGPDLIRAFGEFKAVWDPQNRMNPGKIVRPYRSDENLRLGPQWKPSHPPTHFRFAADNDSFTHATTRCVGVGKCRRLHGEADNGTMCPSFMVTREEKHSTRGRSRLLFEMLAGDPLRDGWKDEHVKEALDLCLSCKGCKGDCPVNVDMATYKAEFLSHYYEGRVRPASAYSMGLIPWWSRLAALLPQVVNTVMRQPVVSDLLKSAAGIAPQRSLPLFAEETFRDWFGRRPPGPTTGDTVILWPDTFTNHFHPEIGRAAVAVLERLGYRVRLPAALLCCGRPLYDYGMLDTARRMLVRILDALQPDIDAGTPIVGLEPSCVVVFRDELPDLLPDDPRSLRLSRQVMVLSEFLNLRRDLLPKLPGRALLQVHCHQKAVIKLKSETEVLQRLGLECEMPEPGCCGMAGSFGFEKEHYDISMQIAERNLLPAVRRAPADRLVIADGFSCRTQIEQATGRRPLHLAEVLAQAFEVDVTRPTSAPVRTRVAATFAGAIAAGFFAVYLFRRGGRKRRNTPKAP